MKDYPWYGTIKGTDLQQGDFIDRYDIVRGPEKSSGEILVDKYDLIVITQSCDIPKSTTTHIVLCPVISLEQAVKIWPRLQHEKEKEKLRRGLFYNIHLLNKCEEQEFERPYTIVSFGRIFEIPKADLLSFIKDKTRLRLLPPYREHLAQAFARFFMRVGLPLDIPPFDRR
jgi:hypothetical protein